VTEESANTPPLAVTKWGQQIPVSCCQLTAHTGVNHCTHPPAPPIPWRKRAQWRAWEQWHRLRRRVGSWIAGVDIEELENQP
jgi:hypothetical protein